jgi:hypothetical protein
VTRLARNLVLLALLAAALPVPARAANFAVTRSDDPAPGGCSPGDCSLREAVAASNANGRGPDAVGLPAGGYRLTRGQLTVAGSLSLTGPSARSTTIDVSGTPGQSRVLAVSPGGAVTVNVAGVTITGGDLQSQDGGGIFLAHAASTLNLFGVAVTRNSAFDGAGIRADGRLNMAASIVDGNHALGVDKGVGPGISFQGAGSGSIVNTNFVRNHGPNRGGAIDYNPSIPGTLALTNDTIADNHADQVGGGIFVGAGTVRLLNTIVARNTVNAGGSGANCRGAVSSAGHNLESANTCGLHSAGDIRHREPRMGRTRNNGGPTDTRDLLSGSPAINGGANASCPGTDQRGVPRPQQGACDIGSFELAQPGAGPRISRLRVTKRWRLDRKGKVEGRASRRRARKGAIFRYRLSENARVVFKIQRSLPGRRSRGGCRRVTARNAHKRHCFRYKKKFGTFVQHGVAGKNRKRFSGKIRKKRIRPGRYRATLVATGVTGLKSKPKRVTFRVVRG